MADAHPPPPRLPTVLPTILLLLLLLPPTSSQPLRFDNGKDVFGRTPLCRACHDFVHNAKFSLVPKLRDVARRLRSAREGASSFGAYESLIQDYVADGACLHSSVYHDAESRRACARLVEDHDDQLIDALYRWAKHDEQGGGGGGGEDAASPSSFHWNREVCSVACPDHLASRPLLDFADDGSATGERAFRSEPPPKRLEYEGHVVRAVGANFNKLAMEPPGVDVVAYLSYPETHRDYHEAAMPTFDDAAAAFASNASVPARFVRIDLDANDLPPPHGTDDRLPKLVLYASGRKTFPVYMTSNTDGKVTVFDFCLMMLNGETAAATREHALRLSKDLPYEALYRAREMYEPSRLPPEFTPKARRRSEGGAPLDGSNVSPKLKYDL